MANFIDFASKVGFLAPIGDAPSPTQYFGSRLDSPASTQSTPIMRETSLRMKKTSKLGVAYVSDASLQWMLDLASCAGLQSEVRVIDGGNRFDLHHVAYAIRRHTHRWEEVANRIKIVRAFTCYEVVKALQEFSPTSGPLIAIDPFATFYDENINNGECFQLAGKCLSELKRIRREAPVVVSLGPPPADFRSRHGLIKLLFDAADHSYSELQLTPPVKQLALL